jgi:taurine dioxygenase
MMATLLNTIADTALVIEPLDAPLGARVLGVDAREPWGADAQDAIGAAFIEHHVLVFPGGADRAVMDPAQMLAFSTRFGDPVSEVNRSKRDGELPQVSHLISTITAREKGGDLKLQFQPAIRSTHFHTDQSFQAIPARATLLHAHEVPSSGGSTWFCDTAAAYDALPDEMKARLIGLKAVHCYDSLRVPHRAAKRTQEEIDDTPEVIHPLVRTHHESGRKALYLNFNRVDRIVGMQRDESDALLDELGEWVAQDRFIYKHTWHVGDTVVWDNRCTLHRVEYDSPAGERRIMLRVVTRGERPV